MRVKRTLHVNRIQTMVSSSSIHMSWAEYETDGHARADGQLRSK
jgi:hypothetical protein